MCHTSFPGSSWEQKTMPVGPLDNSGVWGGAGGPESGLWDYGLNHPQSVGATKVPKEGKKALE